MKFYFIFFISILFFKNVFNEIIELEVNKPIHNLIIKHNQEYLFKVERKKLAPNHFYKLMIHYLGSVISFFLFFKKYS